MGGNPLYNRRFRPSEISLAGLLLVGCLVAVASLLSPAVRAQSPASRIKLVLIGYGDSIEQSREILASVRAAVADLNAEVEMEWIGGERPPPEAKDTARKTAAAREATAVFWREAQQLHIFVPDRGPGTFLVRPIGASWDEGSAHAVGLIMSSAVSSLMVDTRADEPGNGVPDTEEGLAAVTPADTAGEAKEKAATVFSKIPEISRDTFQAESDSKTEQGASSDEATEESKEASSDEAPDAPEDEAADTGAPDEEEKASGPEDKPSTEIASKAPIKDRDHTAGRLRLSAAYGLDVTSQAHPAVNGGRFGIGALIYRKIVFTVDYTVSQRLEMPLPDIDAALEVRRHPIAVGLGLDLALKRWRLGPGVIVELDVVSEDASSSDDTVAAIGEATRVRASVVPHVNVGFRIAGPLFGALHLGMRVLTDKPRYRSEVDGEGRVVYEPWRVQARFSAGVYAEFF